MLVIEDVVLVFDLVCVLYVGGVMVLEVMLCML